MTTIRSAVLRMWEHAVWIEEPWSVSIALRGHVMKPEADREAGWGQGGPQRLKAYLVQFLGPESF